MERVRRAWGSAATCNLHQLNGTVGRDFVFVEFCVKDSKEVKVDFEKTKVTFSCVEGPDNTKHLNEVEFYQSIKPNESKHKRTDRCVFCCIRKGESGQSWPRLTKEKAKLCVNFNNWKDWEDDSDEDMSNFDRFSKMISNMGGDEDVDLPEVDGAGDDSADTMMKKCLTSNKRRHPVLLG